MDGGGLLECCGESVSPFLETVGARWGRVLVYVETVVEPIGVGYWCIPEQSIGVLLRQWRSSRKSKGMGLR